MKGNVKLKTLKKNEDNILQLINLCFPFLSQKNIKTIEQYKEWKTKNIYLLNILFECKTHINTTIIKKNYSKSFFKY